MTLKNHFLFEIGTEELPAKTLKQFSENLGKYLRNEFDKLQLSYGNCHLYATPRRLAVLVEDLIAEQPSFEIERFGPALTAAFDKEGKPTQACVGFAQSCETQIDQLERIETPKGARLAFRKLQVGEKTEKLLPVIVQRALEQLPKSMRWSSKDIQFIRPVHWVLLIYGNTFLEVELFGVKSSNKTMGHRFHHPGSITIENPLQYEQLLREKGYVIADFEQRQEVIKMQIEEKAASIGGQVVINEDLLAEVTGLVEWPEALLGSFKRDFLQVPPEALISSMKNHQKCFPIVDANSGLHPNFITVCNVQSREPEKVIHGNERVMHARLSDAAFFYREDLKTSLNTHVEKLKNIVFQQKLGSLYDKIERVTKLCVHIAKMLKVPVELAERSAYLSKADLLTAMVGEFPELQGIMGNYYAKHDREPSEVCMALEEYYLPRFSGDDLPDSDLGSALAIADRLDTIVAFFGVNRLPTGDKDPFGLRRAALGILHIIIENGFSLDLEELITYSMQTFTISLENKHVHENVLTFFFERLRAWYLEQGTQPDTFMSVLEKRPAKPYDFEQRVQAVTEFRALEASAALAAANKRVSNLLLNQVNNENVNSIDVSLLQLEQEKILVTEINKKRGETEHLYQEANYKALLASLADLRNPVDNFFDHVMVMVEDERLRKNRLAILANLRSLFLQVADISLLQQ